MHSRLFTEVCLCALLIYNKHNETESTLILLAHQSHIMAAMQSFQLNNVNILISQFETFNNGRYMAARFNFLMYATM